MTCGVQSLVRIAIVLLLAVPCAKAAEPPASTPQNDERSTAERKESSILEKQNQKRIKRAEHLAEKSADRDFLNSPDGIASKQLLSNLDQELNAVYEKYLNLCHVDPDTEEGKRLRQERRALLDALVQKRKQAEREYEQLKRESPVHRAMYEKHLKSQMSQLRGKLKTEPSEDGDEDDDDGQ